VVTLARAQTKGFRHDLLAYNLYRRFSSVAFFQKKNHILPHTLPSSLMVFSLPARSLKTSRPYVVGANPHADKTRGRAFVVVISKT
jgi:hypothetical protein